MAITSIIQLLTKVIGWLSKEGGFKYELKNSRKNNFSIGEASEYLGISYWLTNQLVRRKQLPYLKVGGKFLFRVQVLDEYLTKKEQDSVC